MKVIFDDYERVWTDESQNRITCMDFLFELLIGRLLLYLIKIYVVDVFKWL